MIPSYGQSQVRIRSKPKLLMIKLPYGHFKHNNMIHKYLNIQHYDNSLRKKILGSPHWIRRLKELNLHKGIAYLLTTLAVPNSEDSLHLRVKEIVKLTNKRGQKMGNWTENKACLEPLVQIYFINDGLNLHSGCSEEKTDNQCR